MRCSLKTGEGTGKTGTVKPSERVLQQSQPVQQDVSVEAPRFSEEAEELWLLAEEELGGFLLFLGGVVEEYDRVWGVDGAFFAGECFREAEEEAAL